MNWKKLTEENPHCYKYGDRLLTMMSDELLLMDKLGFLVVGVCYQDFVKGSEYYNFFDMGDNHLPDITYFCEIIKPEEIK